MTIDAANASASQAKSRGAGFQLLILAFVVLPLSIFAAFRTSRFFAAEDADHYLALAAGKPAMLPFASRQLSPLLVRGLAGLAHLSIQQAFLLEGVLWLAGFFALALWPAIRSGSPRWLVMALAGMLFWSRQFSFLAMPDLLYDVLLACLLALLGRRRFLLAALIVLPLTVCRESTLLTLFCLLVAGWRRMRWTHLGTALASFGAGTLIVARLTQSALPNHEHLPPMIYTLAKLPWNLSRNLFGVFLWSNLYQLSCPVPQHVFEISLGSLRAIGVCGQSWLVPSILLYTGASAFGLLPLLFAWMVWSQRRSLRQIWRGQTVLIRFALLYGILSFVLTPALGQAFNRLFDYSWPVFLVALPLLIVGRGAFRSRTATVAFLAVHLLLSWSPLVLERNGLLLFALAANLVGALLLWSA